MTRGVRVAPWLPGSSSLLALAVLAGCATPPAPVPVSRQLPVPQQQAAPSPAETVDDHVFALQGTLTQGGYAIGQAPVGTVSLTLDGQPVTLAEDGRFPIGFSRDAPPVARLEAVLADGRKVIARITIAQRHYDVQSIPGLPGKSSPDPAYEKLRRAERARIDGARALHLASDGWRQQWLWPVTGRISGVYGSQRILGGVPHSPHFGVDIAAPAGTPIVAPADGVVVLASPPAFSLEGNLLIIDHGMGVNTAYLHMSRIDVVQGDHVRRGQVIGLVGSTGRATGPHLHWTANWLDRRLDPALVAGPMP